MEKFHTVHKERSAGYFVGIAMWIVLMMVVASLLFLFFGFQSIIAILFVEVILSLILVFLFIRVEHDYDYNYYNGVLIFAKVRNKNRRRVLYRLELDKAKTIAPKGDRSIYKYENDSQITHKNFTSGKYAQNVYAVIGQDDKDRMVHIEFEGDDEFLTAIWDKYSQIMVYKPGAIGTTEETNS